MTTLQAVQAGIPRWMALAMPEDVAQELALSTLIAHTAAQRRDWLAYRMRELRRTQWERRPCKPAHVPSSMRPSKLAGITGYRIDPTAHRQARQKINVETRRAIARKGAQARWKAQTGEVSSSRS